MPLERWELHLLGLLAKNPSSLGSKELFDSFKGKLSKEAKQTAKEILEADTASAAGISDNKSSEILMRRAATRNELRQMAQTLT